MLLISWLTFHASLGLFPGSCGTVRTMNNASRRLLGCGVSLRTLDDSSATYRFLLNSVALGTGGSSPVCFATPSCKHDVELN